MSSMKQIALVVPVIAAALLAGAAAAQSTLPGSSQFNPPPPPPPPPPKIEVPKVPQFDAKPSYNYRPAPRRSYGDRVSKCLDDAAAAGMTPGERATYSRSCAQQ
ncbi:hypothetical protein [Bradyrhizobium sp.]|uniref:hypothetical protein n=1 Tax=Bradyrhizobium sp. TaxID=376 RepID=UPI0023980385|nr:hypothetical protein [Bradyrhizobium sp.]MDE2378956.1 hypothetical protein [Bradyrhizobium sp.]